jgi:hypothetical protein
VIVSIKRSSILYVKQEGGEMYLQQKTKKHAYQELILLLFISSARFILGGKRPFRFASHLGRYRCSLVGVCNARRIRRRNAQSIIVTGIAGIHLRLCSQTF